MADRHPATARKSPIGVPYRIPALARRHRDRVSAPEEGAQFKISNGSLRAELVWFVQTERTADGSPSIPKTMAATLDDDLELDHDFVGSAPPLPKPAAPTTKDYESDLELDHDAVAVGAGAAHASVDVDFDQGAAHWTCRQRPSKPEAPAATPKKAKAPPARKRLVLVEGNIGVGKSTILQALR